MQIHLETLMTQNKNEKTEEKGTITLRPSAVRTWLLMLVGVAGVGGGSIGVQHLIPALTPDKEVAQTQVNSAVETLMSSVVTAAKADIEKDMDENLKELKKDLKESIADKLNTVSVALKAMVKLNEAEILREAQGDAALRRELDEMNKQISILRSAVQSIEEELDAGIEMAPLVFEGETSGPP